MFLKDAVSATIGFDVPLDVWARKAIYEKLTNDIESFYKDFGRSHTGVVADVAARHPEDHHGLLYLHREKIVVVLQVVSRRVIEMIRAHPGLDPGAVGASHVREALDASGAPCAESAVLYFPFDSNDEADIHVTAQSPEDEDRTRIRNYVNGLAVATIIRSSARDIQRLPGPSDLSNPCDLCLARRLSQSCGVDMAQGENFFSLKAWFGTSMHEKLERDLPKVYPHAEQEITVPIAVIQGLGQIKGHVDIYLPRLLAMDDWKSTDMKKLDKIRANGVSPSHFGQTMLYMYGLRKSGRSCDYAALTYIPRDSQNVSDIWVASCSYREDVAVGLLNRTNSLMQKLKSGDVGSFLSDPDCYVCHVQSKVRR